MGLRDKLGLRSTSHNKHSTPNPSALPKTYAPLPPTLAEPVILTLSYPTPTIAILSQALDSKPVFQIDYSPILTITHIPTSTPIGTVTFGENYKITLNHKESNTATTYADTLNLPLWFQTLGGNNIYWIAQASNAWQLTIHGEIIDGINHPDDEDDIAAAIILDSKWKKGRIEIRKAMPKVEMDLLLLSAVAEIKDRRVKMMEQGVSTAGIGGAAKGAAGPPKMQKYLHTANAGIELAGQVQAAGDGGGGGGGDGGGGGGGGDGGGGGGGC